MRLSTLLVCVTRLPRSTEERGGCGEFGGRELVGLDMEAIVQEVYGDLVEDVCLGLCLEAHRSVKCGFFFIDEMDPEGMQEFEIVDKAGVDVFGQVFNQCKNRDCECPNCGRTIAAARFAPHLEKCLGMGRNSSRLANRRLANSNSNNMTKSESDPEDNDDVNDNDWSYSSEKKGASRTGPPAAAKKRKVEKNPNSPRRAKPVRHKNGDLGGATSESVKTCQIPSSSNAGSTSSINYESLGPQELKSFLSTQCGVVSEHTKKMCTRSHRCPQHTDDQRRSVRLFLLGPSGSALMEPEDVDVDGFDVGDSTSYDTSPSDSVSSKASTNASESKKKKKPPPAGSLSGSSGAGSSSGSNSSSKKKKIRPPTPGSAQ
ncbi:ataxin-7-like protein 3 isoform X2 [Lethenteron reissneri]|uniref:ataxin-7-like protein 3 isoform X2 n=1 Tax=Lethenteron reissneri TaxID=7753 RepID=UPI002AB65563|nr:ataxin-7-like protein 3 isoform X2 [Lethenteron reissneri]